MPTSNQTPSQRTNDQLDIDSRVFDIETTAAADGLEVVESTNEQPSECEKNTRLVMAIIASPALGALSSVVAPALTAELLKAYTDLKTLHLAIKIAAPIISWAVYFVARTWLLGNGIGRRILDGKADKKIPVQTIDQTFATDGWHVALAVFANTSQLVSGPLVAQTIFSLENPTAYLTIGLVPGILSFILKLLTEVTYSFRKHAEHKAKIGIPIQSFLAQPGMHWCYTTLYYLARICLWINPPLSAFIRAVAVIALLSSFVSPSPIILLASLPLLFLVMQSTAFVATFFDHANCRDNFEAIGTPFPLNNSTSESTWISNILRKLHSGEALLYLLKKTGLSTPHCVDVILSFSSIGLFALLQLGLSTYIISSDAPAIERGSHAKLMDYTLGTQKTIYFGKNSQGPTLFVSAVGGIASNFIAKRGDVLAEILNSEKNDRERQENQARHQPTVLAGCDDEEQADATQENSKRLSNRMIAM